MRAMYRLLIAIPLISLGLNAFFLVRWGVDIPFWDDWRQYDSEHLGSFNLHYLFTPINDTLFPVGQFLDSLAFRLFGAHAVAYQLLSLVAVQGALLWLIWQLLGFSGVPFLIRALAFCFTLPMLQPDSYWGLQNLAYHQAVPLVMVLAVLYLVLRPTTPSWATYVFIGFLSFISGLSYVSGAFAVLGLSVVLLCFGSSYRRFGWALLLPALLCTVAQLWVILFYQKGMHLDDFGMAYPWQIDFWMYALGKVGRALLLSPLSEYAGWSLAITVLVLVLWGALLWLRPSLPLVALTVVVGLYLGLVAAGRANYRAEDIATPIQVFQFGFIRFHFFWLTVIWPFLVVALWQLRVSRWALGLIVIPVLWLGGTAVWHYSSYYEGVMGLRQQGLTCLNQQLALASQQTDPSLHCPPLHPVDTPELLPADLMSSVKNAISHQASFVEQLNFAPINIDTTEPTATFSMPALPWQATTHEPLLIFHTQKVQELQQCLLLDVSVKLHVESAAAIQFFYIPLGQPNFSETHSVWLRTSDDQEQVLHTRLSSATGFLDAFRLDLGVRAEPVVLEELVLRCRLTK